MPTQRSLRGWFRLPGRIALILGLGALSTAGARADAAEGHQRADLGDVLIRAGGGKIYLSESGRETELRLSATPQRDHLLRLLQQHGAPGVKLDRDPRLIMSGGGGTGFSLWDTKKPVTNKPAPAPQDPPQVTAPPDLPKQELAPRDRDPAADKRG